MTTQVLEVLERHAGGKLVIAPTSDPKVRAVQLAEVGARLTRLTGAAVDVDGGAMFLVGDHMRYFFDAELGYTFDNGGMHAFNVMGAIFGISYAGFGVAAFAAAAIFWRFRLPFSLFLLAGCIAGLFYTAVGQLGGAQEVIGGAAMLGIGVATLIVAIAFDMRDPTRTTRNADHAFWLHMAAAPQIILGVRGLLLGSGFAPAGMTDATVMLIVLIAFALLSLALNRRALIVSGLVTFATSLWFLVNELGGGGVNTLMLTALIIGGAIVLLGGGWRTARRVILKVFPQEGTLGRIFPPEPA